MKRSILALLCGISIMATATVIAAPGSDTTAPQGVWAERVQVIYVAETKSVVRKTVRVWDPHPEKQLDFVWEPAPGVGAGISADGTIEGRGKLIWRVRGSASYDPRTIFSTYEGDLRDGRPHGKGRLEIRSGETYDGDWVAGLANGKGVRVDEAGNRYEGAFRAGFPHGEGKYLSRTGEIFTGGFVDGQREGRGTTRLAGGTVYQSEWKSGREIGKRPDTAVDASVGGLLRAQSGGGDADRVEIATVIDDRMNQQSAMQYQHLVRDEDVAIYPLEDPMNEAWNGTALINESAYAYSGIDFEDAPAFVNVGVATTDGSRVRLQKLELQVANSEAYRKPMLTLERHFGCVGFRPTFSFFNHGWGEVQNARLNFSFGGQEDGSPQSRAFSIDAGSFDQGADVNIKQAFVEAGVKTDVLETERFQCQSMDSLNVCRSQLFNKVGFGDLADFVWGDQYLTTTMRGTVDYTWADDGGNAYQASEPFQVDVSLAVIEVPEVLAECGDGFNGSPEALRYQRIDLPTGQRDYAIDLPVRGNNNISKYDARLKMYAEMSSFHQFQPVATFEDGSERRGKPVSLFYFKPRSSEFHSSARPQQCYLSPEIEGC